MSLVDGTFKPAGVSVLLEAPIFKFAPVYGHLREFRRFAGAGIGMATVQFPMYHAQDTTLQMGTRLKIYVDGVLLFRGTIGEGPFDIADNSDEIAIMAFDDKWDMSANIIGQYGIGTQGTPAGATGFADVGFNIVFNPDGMPNKKNGSLEFNSGTGAVYWTCKDILQFLFQYYVASSVATVSATAIGTSANWLKKPNNVELVGMDALKAIDTVVQLAGESWGLVPGENASAFTRVAPGSGTAREIRLFPPKGKSKTDSATIYHPSSVQVGLSVRECRDVYQAKSAPRLVEHTYEAQGSNPLLTQVSGFKDKEYSRRYKVDVTKYGDHHLGQSLTAGSKPKKMLAHLLTRINAAGTAYLSATEIALDDTLRAAKQVEEPFVYIAQTTSRGNAKLVVGGCRVDHEAGTVDFKDIVKIMRDSDDTGESMNEDWPQAVRIIDWSFMGVWLTIVTVLEVPEFAVTDTASTYLPRSFNAVIERRDLIPEARYKAVLPDLSNNGHNATIEVGATEEKYVDITTQLADVVANAIAATPRIDVPVTASFPFVPTINLGDNLVAKGRTLGTTGKEVVVELTYSFTNGMPDELGVTARAIVADMDASKFIRGR